MPCSSAAASATRRFSPSCWQALRPGGRLVANAVTVAGEAALASLAERHNGELTRIAIARAQPLGRHRAFRPLLAVTQLALRKNPDAA